MSPRFIQHVGLTIADTRQGTSVLTLRVEPHHLNGNGVVHGGALFTLADTAMGTALISALPRGERCATVDARITYLRAVRQGTVVVCTAHLIHREADVAHLEAVMVVDGVEVARATGVFAVMAIRE